MHFQRPTLRRTILCILAASLALPVVAAAHVTLQPAEWEPGAFSRVVVRVPNERPDADTTTVTLQFPENVPTARFQPHPNCERTIERAPVEAPTEELEERIVSVTWTCKPGIKPDEFEEFGISFRVPEDLEPGDEVVFPAIQTYSGGEEVGWIDPNADGDTPAPRITVIAPAGEEEEEAPAEEEEASADTTTESVAPIPAASSDDGSGMETAAIIFGLLGLTAGLVAIGFALFRKPTS